MNLFRTLAAAGIMATGAVAQLQPGDLAFTGFNADGNDDLAFVTFKDIPAGDTLRFCDSEWNGTGFGTDEGDFAWVATSLVPAGTVVVINNLGDGTISASVGEIPEALDESGGLSTGGEAMFVFQGSGPRDVSVMLAAVSNNTADEFGVLTGTGLVAGTSAIVLPSSADIAVYDGPRSGLDQAGYLAALNDMDNWLWEDTGDDDHDNGTPPDLPFDPTAFTLGAAPPALGPGDLAFTGFNADGDDDLAFVALKDIPANTRIHFCDSEWDGTGFGTDEGDYSWSHTEDVPAGTVVSLTGVGSGPVPSLGTIVHDDAGGIGNDDEAVFAYLAIHPDSLRRPSVFLGAVATRPSSFGTLEGTGLTAGTTAIVLPTDLDIAAYAGPRTGLTAAAYRAALNDTATWIWQNDGGDQSNDAIAPDVPFDLTAFIFGDGDYTPPAAAVPAFAFEADYAAARENEGSLQVRLTATAAPSDTARLGIRLVAAGTAAAGTDFAFADHVYVWPMDSAGPRTLSIPLTDNAVAHPDKFFVIELHDPVNGTLGARTTFSGYILDDEAHAPEGSDELDLTFVSSHLVDSTSGASAEIVAHDPASQRLFVMNSTRDRLEILDFRNPRALSKSASIDLSAHGAGGTSVAVKDGLAAVSIDAPDEQPGKVVFLDTNGAVLKSVTVGSLPDMVTFTPDGRYLLVANEGQPRSDYSFDPEGSVSIIDLRGGIDSVTQARVHTAGFTDFNAQKAALQAAGVRIFGPGASVAQDLEPEYIAVSEDSKTAWATLQENNAIARVDLETKTITDVFPMGFKDHSLPRNALDASDRADSIMMMTWPIKGVYMPDAIAAMTVGDTTFLFTANEGDAREYAALEEEVRIGSSGYPLDTAVFPNHRILKQEQNLGRLSATTAGGDTDEDGYFEEIHVFGARSFSVWDGTTGAQVWDSGDEMERIVAADATYGALFNAGNDNNDRKNRSDNKGPEPEGIAIGRIGDKAYAFIALERIGGVMAYDVTDPRAPRFVAWANNRTLEAPGGDLGSEGIIFIPRAQSPNDTTLIVLANEVSATVSVYSVRDTAGPAGVRPPSGNAAVAEALTLHRVPGRDLVFFSRPVDYRLVDARGRVHRAARAAAWMDLHGLKSGRYFLAVPGEKTHVLPVMR